MASVVLEALSGGATVYTATVVAGTLTGTPPLSPALLASVDRLRLPDPVTGISRVEFSVYPGSLQSNNFPQQMNFSTRCFLTPPDTDSLAPVQLKFNVLASDIELSEAQVFGIDPDGDPHFPMAIAALCTQTFTPSLGSPVDRLFHTPAAIARIGIQGFTQAGTTDDNPVLVCTPTPKGIEFALSLPLAAENQQVKTYSLSFKYNGPGIPIRADGSPALLFTQRDASPAPGVPNFWFLDFQIPSDPILSVWNSMVPKFLNALNQARGGLPASFIPMLAAEPGSIVQFDLTFTLIDKGVGNSTSSNNCVLRDPDSKTTPGMLNIVNRTIAISGAQTLNATATFPNLIRADGQALQAACALMSPVATDTGDITPNVAGFDIGFKHLFEPYSATLFQPVVRMGALDLCFPAASPASDLGRGPSSLQASFRTVRSVQPGTPASQGDDLPGTLVRLDFLSISLAVYSLGIGGQDSVPGAEYAPSNQPYPRGQTGQGAALSARRAPALQIARDGRDFPLNGAYFVLDVTETCYELTSQTLMLAIEQQRLSAAADGSLGLDLIVIDTEPFMVARVMVPDYQAALRAALTDQIASWDNNAADGGWDISVGTQAFQMMLPPQGLTEAMHKGKGLGDINIGQAVDFRLTPPATFNLRSSTAAQNYVEVPWNLRRVLGYASLVDSGAVLESADFELLYGLAASLTSPPGTTPGWMLSEIAARLGSLAAAPNQVISWQHSAEQEHGYATYIGYWASIIPQIMTRLAVLEPWSATQPLGLALTDQDGLSFQLRSEADLAYPTQIETPVPTNIPQGDLKGSFSWAFESQRLYEGIWSNQSSFSSALSGLHFSSLGGWGDLTARFNLGKTSIIASIRMGRVQKLTIEQVGRIGNFWNKSKYVITYERTVAATDQFAGEQFPFSGNPILRKTAEYIQITETSRAADTSSDPLAATYAACDFPEGDPPKIPVEGAWGQNVGQYGYRIPLWRPGAQPTDVYVKPLVRLQLQSAVADPNDTAGQTVPAEIVDPEKLYFYTTVDPSASADTDTWPPVHSVDFGFVTTTSVSATPQALVNQATSASQGNIAGFNVDEEPWVQPGLGAFTYNLKPTAVSANVVAGKGATNAIGAMLHTITIMRGLTTDSVIQAGTPYVQSVEIPDHVSNILRPLIAQVSSAEYVAATAAGDLTAWADLTKSTVARAQTCLTALQSFSGNIPSAASQLCAALLAQFQNQLSVLNAQINNEVSGAAHGAYEFLVPATAPADFAAFKTGWTALYNTAESGLRFTRSELQSCTNSLVAESNSIVNSFTAELTALDTLLAGVGNDITTALTDFQQGAAALDQVLADGDAAINTILLPISGGNIDKVRQALTTFRSQVSSSSQSAIASLQAGEADPATAIAQARGVVASLKQACTQLQTQVINPDLQALGNAASTFVATHLEVTLDSINTKLQNAPDWNTFQTQANAELTAISSQLLATVDQHLADLTNQMQAYATLACQQILFTDLKAALGVITNLINPQAMQQYLDCLQSNLPSGPELQQGIEDYLHGLESSVGQFLNAVRPQLTVPPIPVPTTLANAGIALLRAFGDVPKVPQLDFGDVDFTAYRYTNLINDVLSPLPEVNLTPLAGFANNLANGIGNPLNLAVPTVSLLDNLVPVDLSSFDLNSLFPHIAGLDLSNLFQSVKIPSNPYVDVTHGEDLQARSAWVTAKAHVEFTDEIEIFSYFGVTLTLLGGKFDANTTITGTLGGAMTRTMSGAISGNWSLTVGGYDIVILAQCTLTFDESGKFGFNVDPTKVQLQGILQFLAEILSDFFSGDAFTTTVDAAGMQTVLDLPLPDIQSGTFGLANLHLMCSFGITFVPFAVHAGLGVASFDNPFTLTVFILGGAGYLALDVLYIPAKNSITATFSIGMFASASLAISLGPISGGVYAYFGISVSYIATTGSAPDLQITLALMFIGEVSLLGFVSVYLSLSLSGTYDSQSKTLIGNGSVQYSIKIGPFFSINVSSSVSYSYSNHALPAGQQPAVSAQTYLDAATEYLEMFYN